MRRFSKKVAFSVPVQSIGSSSIQLNASSRVTRPRPYAFSGDCSAHNPAPYLVSKKSDDLMPSGPRFTV
ncbi:hypothetical protein D3C85_1594360 [compost metagenome]